MTGMNASALTLVIMAAGLGSRYGGLKQVEPVGPDSSILMEYAIFDALREGFGRVVFVVRPEHEATFRERVGARIEHRAEVAYAHQRLELPASLGVAVPEGRAKPWGTGHAVLACRDAVATPFAVINADDFYGRHSYRLLAEELRRPGRGDDFCMAGFRIANTLTDNGTVARGVCDVSADGFLRGVVERTKIRPAAGGAEYTEDGDAWVRLPADAVVSLNTWGFTPALFPALEEGFAAFLRNPATDLLKGELFLPTVVDGMVAAGRTRVKVLASPERWYGMTYREDAPVVRAAIQRMVRDGIYPERLWEA